jgi:putative flippase GtrA
VRPLSRYRRVLRFALVGLTCFAVQYVALRLLTRVGLPATPADAVGFLLSAQLNFTLSSLFTWADRKDLFARPLVGRWFSYNASILVTLAINAGVFQLCRPIGELAASALGVAVGAAGNYVLCDLLVFRDRRGERSAAAGVTLPSQPSSSPSPSPSPSSAADVELLTAVAEERR